MLRNKLRIKKRNVYYIGIPFPCQIVTYIVNIQKRGNHKSRNRIVST